MTWFEELGYEENPFSIKPKKTFEEFFGHKEMIDNLLDKVEEGAFIIVRGKYGTGKTSVLKAIIDEYMGERKVAYVSCYETEKKIDIDEILRKAGNFFSRLFGLKSKNVIFLVDEAHNLMTKNLEELPEYYEDGYLRSVILVTSRPEHKFPKSVNEVTGDNEVKFVMFNEDDAVELIRNRMEEGDEILPEDMIKLIYKKSNTPREFLMNCEDACRKAVERGSDVVEKKDIS
ncbi:AAA family ATPase [Candidatus Woesearchaeota archaeon]|nr:AAA family ATPase [Candidatus Woesearchaeota archaeon]